MPQCVHTTMTKWVTVIVLWAGLCGVAAADLAERIAKIIEPQEGGKHAICVVEPDSGMTVYSYNARTALIPASNMKLITTAAALQYLGPDFEYETKVGVCDSTLVVIGSGDPLLGDKDTDDKYSRGSGWVFEGIVQALQRQRIEEVNDIIVDTTIFDDQRVHPSWPAKDYNKWYACEVCGLNYNANCIEVITSNLGSSVAITIDPQTSFVEIVNKVEATSSGDSAVGAYRNQRPNKITIFGTCKSRQGPFKVAIEQPAAFFGFVLAEHLVRAGIDAKGRLIERAFDIDCAFEPLVEFKTPITDVLDRANTDSLGLAAEALLKTIDAHSNASRSHGSWAGGRDLVGRFLTGLDIPSEEFQIDDGSGLSRENRLSAAAITTVLVHLYRSGNWERFRDSLAVAGEQGTIDRYFKEAKYRGKIIGKTGYISGVRSFSGVCQTKSGPYIFSILSNGPRGLSRDAINDIAKAVMDEYESDD